MFIRISSIKSTVTNYHVKLCNSNSIKTAGKQKIELKYQKLSIANTLRSVLGISQKRKSRVTHSKGAAKMFCGYQLPYNTI